MGRGGRTCWGNGRESVRGALSGKVGCEGRRGQTQKAGELLTAQVRNGRESKKTKKEREGKQEM